MSFRKFICTRCGDTQYAFIGEESRLKQGNCGKLMRWCHSFRMMPPDPTVVHCTNTYMSEAQLDSIKTMYELDKILNYEAREEREIKILNETRINM